MKLYLRLDKYFWILILLPLIFFFSSLFVYFAQDDFFLLHISQVTNLNDLITLFIPHPEVVWYRPLSSQIFFFISQSLFGLRPFLYHLMVMATHLITTVIFFNLLLRLTKNRQLSFITAGFYSINQIHTVSISWLATYSFILGPLCLTAYIYYLYTKQYLKADVSFLAGVLTTELFIVFTPLALFYDLLYRQPFDWWRYTKFMLISLVVIILRLVLFPTQLSSSLYTFSETSFLQMIKFYMLRLAGMPLLFDTLTPLLKLLIVIEVMVITGLLLIGVYSCIRNHIFLPRWIHLFLLTGGAGSIPFLLLPEHVAPYYVSFTLIGVAPIIIWFILQVVPFVNSKQWLVICSLFLIGNIVGVYWTYQTHWIFRRAALAHNLIVEKEFEQVVGSEEYISLGAGAAAQGFKDEH